VRDFVVEWNHRFPMDLWWRRRHRVPFACSQHKGMNLLDILFDMQEEILIMESKAKLQEEKYQPGYGKWGRVLTEEDEAKMFDELDLDSM